MSRTGLAAASIAAVLLVVVGVIVALPRAGRGSALSRGPEGWLAARLYLEARGAEVELLDRSPEELEIAGVLVEVFPWHRADPARVRGLRHHLGRGGALVLAYSGGLGRPEDDALEALGLPLGPVREAPPIGPRAWLADARLEWRLAAEAATGGGRSELTLPAPRWAPRPPPEASVSYRTPGGDPLVFAASHAGGRVVAVPAAALANASLADGGNADLLAGLHRSLGDRWTFDENAHGLAAPSAATGDRLPRVFDLVLVHLAVLYLLAVFALSRRFGPAWQPRPAATGSVQAYLTGLGRLHDRLGHHREAAAMLVERWCELHPRMPPPTAAAAGAVSGGDGLVALARHLARRLSATAAAVPVAGASGILAADWTRGQIAGQIATPGDGQERGR